MDIDETREALLEATLPHVAFDGWTRRALHSGAVDVRLDPVLSDNAFPGGPAEMIAFASARSDQRMLAELETRDLAAMKVRERVATAVRLRLEQLTLHREAVRRGLAFLALPRNAALGTRCLYRTVDTIWRAVGDTSTDYNFYTKRLLLAGVYSSTLLYWLNDDSEDFAQTWAFLDRRIGEVVKIGGNLGRKVSDLLDLPDRLFKTCGAAGAAGARSR